VCYSTWIGKILEGRCKYIKKNKVRIWIFKCPFDHDIIRGSRLKYLFFLRGTSYFLSIQASTMHAYMFYYNYLSSHVSGFVISTSDDTVPHEEIPRCLWWSTVTSIPTSVATSVQLFGGQISGHSATGSYAKAVAEHWSRRHSLKKYYWGQLIIIFIL